MKKIYVEMVADLFHYGHVEFLRKAKALGDYLVVGVLSDAWVRANKKEAVLTQDERARVIAGCRYVDEVVLQDQPATAQWLRDNAIAHNAIAFRDSTDKERHERVCADYDVSREVVLPYEQSISTTDIITRIHERAEARKNEIAMIKQAFAPRWAGGEWLLAEQMLQDIKQLLARHAIPFFLTFGSLLGAARHQGVVPWDDDIDIAIFHEHDDRFKSLVKEFNALGYSLVDLKKQSPRGESFFYKICMLDTPSNFTLPFSWPYIDIFILQASDKKDVRVLDGHEFPENCFLPLAEAKFEGLTLPVPAKTPELLTLMYAPDYMTTCVSAHFIHRQEKEVQSYVSPASAVKEAGCFVSLHAMAEAVLAFTPLQAPGWTLVKEGTASQLVKDTLRLQVSDALGELWRKLDGTISVGTLIDASAGPRIVAMQRILGGLKMLERGGATKTA